MGLCVPFKKPFMFATTLPWECSYLFFFFLPFNFDFSFCWDDLMCGMMVGGEKKCLNSELWHACAGPLVSLPTAGTRVVYFPQGHSEQVLFFFFFHSNTYSTLDCFNFVYFVYYGGCISITFLANLGLEAIQSSCGGFCWMEIGVNMYWTMNGFRLPRQLTGKLMVTYRIIRVCRPSWFANFTMLQCMWVLYLPCCYDSWVTSTFH